jgi:hypothetical protein
VGSKGSHHGKVTIGGKAAARNSGSSRPPRSGELARAIADYEITEAEFEAAKAYLAERRGEIPASLQRVIDRGGRFKRATVVIEQDERQPWRFDEHDLAVIGMYEGECQHGCSGSPSCTAERCTFICHEA